MLGGLLVSERLYGALLYLYPKQFRAAYGQQMRLTFRDTCRVAYHRNGAGGLLALWLPTLLDLFKSALEERARQGELTMSNARLIGLAGPLTILVGSVWLVASSGDLLLRIGPERADTFWYVFSFFTFFLSFVPLLIALIGTRLRFHQAAGVPGRLGLALGVAGCAGMIVVALAGLLVRQGFWINYSAEVCFLSLMIGYMLFGVDALRYKLLPRWNLSPLLLGSIVVLSVALDWFGVPAFLSMQWATPFLYFVVTGACWVLLGMALLDPRREPQPTAAS